MMRLALLAAALVMGGSALAGDLPIQDRQIEITLDRFNGRGDAPAQLEAEQMLAERRAPQSRLDGPNAAAVDLLLIADDWRQGTAFLEDRRSHR
jgi:hypothetical protein